MRKLAVFSVSIALVFLQGSCRLDDLEEDNEGGPQTRTLLLAGLYARLALGGLGTTSFMRPGGYYGSLYPVYGPALPVEATPPPTPDRPPIDIPVLVDEFGNYYYQQTLPNGQTQLVFLPPEFLGIFRDAIEKALGTKFETPGELEYFSAVRVNEATAQFQEMDSLLFSEPEKTPTIGIFNTKTDYENEIEVSNREMDNLLFPASKQTAAAGPKMDNLLFPGTNSGSSQGASKPSSGKPNKLLMR